MRRPAVDRHYVITLHTFKTGTNELLKSVTWGYDWTNRAAKYSLFEEPNKPEPPAKDWNCAVSYKHNRKGTFSNIRLVQGLEALN